MKTDWWAITLYVLYGAAFGAALAEFNWPGVCGFAIAIWWFYVAKRQQKILKEVHDGLQAMRRESIS
jgi:hypothetical protein